MVSELKTDVFLSTLSAAVQSKDGDLVALVEDLEAVGTPKLCRLDLQELAEVSRLRPGPGASVAVSAEDLAALLEVAAFAEVLEVVTGAALVVEGVV